MLVVGHVEELLGAALDERVQRVLHQLQVVQLSLELLLVDLQEAGDLTAASATSHRPPAVYTQCFGIVSTVQYAEDN